MADRYDDHTPCDETESGTKDNTTSFSDGENEDPTGSNSDLQRRSLLKLIGSTSVAAAVSGLSGIASAETTYNGITFDRVVDAVDDLGMDPTGSEPIDAAFESALETGTLIEFPPGEYLLEDDHYISDVSRFGVRGLGNHRRDVQFLPAKGSAIGFFEGGGPGPYTVENVSFNERDDEVSMMYLDIRSNKGVYVNNIEFLGVTPLDDKNGHSLAVDVWDQDAVGIWENVYAGLDKPAVKADYPDGVAFFRAGVGHEGEVILRDSAIHERNSAATRLTAGPGVTTLENVEFVNNQNANIRFGAGNHPSKVSSATGCYVKVDGSRHSGDAIRVDASDNGYAGAVFRDIEIEWTKEAGRGVIALPDWGGHGSAEFYDCTVHNDGEKTLTVNADSVSPDDDAVVLENCSFTGSGRGFDAADRDGSVIRDSCIDMPNASIETFDTENVSNGGCGGNTNGGPSASITVTDKTDLTVELSGADSTDSDGDIVAYDWDVNGSSYQGKSVSHTFDSEGTYSVTLVVEDDDGATDSTTTEVSVSETALEKHLEIRGTGITTEYAFEVSEQLQPVSGTIEEWDDVTETSAMGYVTETSHSDEFTFDGEITSFEFLEGEADVFVDGEQIDPTMDRLEIRGTGTTTEYAFEVSEQLQPVSGTIEKWDDVSGTSATGYVTETGHSDEFWIEGEIASFEFLEGRAEVYRNGDRIYPTESTLTIQGTGTPTEYAVEVGGEIEGVSDTLEGWDDVSGDTANGWVTNSSHVDEFTFTGELTSVEFLQGEADVFVDGEAVDVSAI
ncbi:PKD domain-containing protein [Halapricum desulfuricans]|uniref:Protein containing parallel beta helix region n=1 Tax=Halapricum desulfuricans TaxID=2841257 RepID=A0A897NT96_9EURY|nr:PKD domain-containing protein [Halapricum desulfuricans]QSG16082.1 Protein containing parallel beta helix region [Halapricum desulfuricans]